MSTFKSSHVCCNCQGLPRGCDGCSEAHRDGVVPGGSTGPVSVTQQASAALQATGAVYATRPLRSAGLCVRGARPGAGPSARGPLRGARGRAEGRCSTPGHVIRIVTDGTTIVFRGLTHPVPSCAACATPRHAAHRPFPAGILAAAAAQPARATETVYAVYAPAATAPATLSGAAASPPCEKCANGLRERTKVRSDGSRLATDSTS